VFHFIDLKKGYFQVVQPGKRLFSGCLQAKTSFTSKNKFYTLMGVNNIL